MREYVEFQAASHDSLPGTGIGARLWRNWHARRAVVKLTKLSDHLLRDLGVTRAELNWAAGLPLSVNATLALEEKGRQNRHAGR